MKLPPRSKTPVEIVRRLARSWEALQPILARSLAAEGLDDRVRPGMGLVLFALYEQDGRLIGELARHGHVSHVAALQLVSRIERAGLVRREDCPKDGRATRVWLTPVGRGIEARMHATSLRNREVIVEILGAGGAATLDSLLGRLLDGLANQNAAAPHRRVSARTASKGAPVRRRDTRS